MTGFERYGMALFSLLRHQAATEKKAEWCALNFQFPDYTTKLKEVFQQDDRKRVQK